MIEVWIISSHGYLQLCIIARFISSDTLKSSGNLNKLIIYELTLAPEHAMADNDSYPSQQGWGSGVVERMQEVCSARRYFFSSQDRIG